VQIGEYVLPLEFHTPTTVLRRHRFACTLEFRQLAVRRIGSSLEEGDGALFGLEPMDVADELTAGLVQLGLSECSEVQLWKNSDNILVGKKQQLVTDTSQTYL
jgi:hypothetical protein